MGSRFDWLSIYNMKVGRTHAAQLTPSFSKYSAAVGKEQSPARARQWTALTVRQKLCCCIKGNSHSDNYPLTTPRDRSTRTIPNQGI